MKRYVLLLLMTSLISSNCLAREEITVAVSSDMEITVDRYPAKGQYLILWLAPEYGFRTAHRSFANMLAQQNIEVWQSNIVESLFLPQSTLSMKQLDGQYIADVIEYAHKETGKQIIIAGDSYGAANALIGAHNWQKRKLSNPYLIGAILFSPYTYAYIPPLGLPPEFLPVVSSTNIPIMVYQAKNSGNIGQFKTLLNKLQQHNNPVYTKYTADVMSLFYEDPPSQAMIANATPLPANILKMIKVLEKHDVPTKPVPLKSLADNKSGIDIYLKQFKGNNQPISINLKNVKGETFDKNQFKGKVTIINFWATWCPPCIEEIPSLNRLNKKMKDFPFELISINYAEDRQTILDFLKKVNVEFPVLLDQNGDYARKWKVVTYPSTFVIDSNGKIRYGVNAAIEWDDPELINTIKSLL